MSAPNVGLKRSEYINFSLLAVRTSNALKAVLDGKQLPEDDRAVLSRAASFLEEVSTGADFVAHGRFQAGFSPTRSVTSLHQAMEPIKRLRRHMKDNDVASFFEQLAKAVSDASAGRASNGARNELNEAMEFFDAFYETLAAEINTKYPTVGTPLPR